MTPSRKPCESVSSAFDWQRMEVHVETIRQELMVVPWILLEPGGFRGDVVHDPFGKTIHGTDKEHTVGKVYRIGEAGIAWHSEVVPIFARVLRPCSRAEAKRMIGRKLIERQYYYEVLVE